jgi:hypothetical protein
MQSCGQIMLRRLTVWNWNGSKASMPMAKCVFEGSVQDVDANIKEALDGVTIPPHLLLLDHPLGDNFIDRRLGEPGRYSDSHPVAFAVVRHRVRV